MKVCILGENGSVHIQKWISAISAHTEIELHVITFKRGLEFEGVKYHYLQPFFNNKIDYLLNVKKVKNLLKKIKPQLIHAHYATSYGFLGAFSNFKPFIITGWGADIFDSPKSFVMKNLLEYGFSKANAITVLSEVTRTEIKKLTKKDVSLIPFGIDLQKFTLTEKPKSEIIRIGTIRTLSEKYGVEFLIKAFSILYPKYPNVYLDIVGDGPQRKFLEELAVDLGISDRIKFHGFVNQNAEFERYINILQSFDIFAILSVIDSETFGVAAVEASACGIPVVASNVGGLPEVIQNEVTGLIVRPRDPQSTALALQKLIENSQLRLELGNNGRKRVELNYNWKKNVQQMISLYQEVISSSIL